MVKNISPFQKFEDFVLSVLKQICVTQKKRIYTSYDIDDYFNIKHNIFDNKVISKYDLKKFDAFMPDGFLNFTLPVIVEIKHNISKSFFSKKSLNTTDCIILFIVNNLNVSKLLKDSLKTKNVEIWDYNDIRRWKNKFPIDYYGLFSNEEIDKSQIDFYNKNETNIERLKNLVLEKKLSLSLGAGVSIDFGAMSWSDLISSFYNELRKNNKVEDPIVVQNKIGGTSIINGKFAKDNLKDFMASLYNGLYANFQYNSRYNNSTISYLIPLIKRLKSSSRFNIITYNYDNFLEQALDKEMILYNSLFNENCKVDNRFCIYHPHGFLPYKTSKSNYTIYEKNIIFGESEYNSLNNNPYSWSSVLQYYLYRENIYLFVGCSLADPNLRRVLSNTRIRSKYHFALMLKDNLSPKDQFIVHKHFMQMGVECIWAENINEYKKILECISK